MYYVYILTNLDRTKTYIGFTSDLKRRLEEHKNGSAYWTRCLNSLVLFYYEAYITKDLARDREKKLKARGSSKTGLFKRIGLK